LIGIITVIVTVATLYFSYKSYKSREPDLSIKVTHCQHDFPKILRKGQVKDINFNLRFEVTNKGDRGTRIKDIVLSFVVKEKNYQINETNLTKDMWDIIKLPELQTADPDKWIGAHDTRPMVANFNSPFDGPEENQIECVFTIADVHKVHTLKATSEKVERPPIEPKPLTK
jgi:hypothetical protein